METKLSKLKKLFEAGDHIGALRIAAKFPQLGEQKVAITRAWAAVQNPGFYRQLDMDPEVVIQIGINALKRRYKIV